METVTIIDIVLFCVNLHYTSRGFPVRPLDIRSESVSEFACSSTLSPATRVSVDCRVVCASMVCQKCTNALGPTDIPRDVCAMAAMLPL